MKRANVLLAVAGAAGLTLLLSVVSVAVPQLLGHAMLGALQQIPRHPLYRATLLRAQHDPAIADALGGPVHDEWPPSLSIDEENCEGHATVEIPVVGPRGAGLLHATFSRSDCRWKMTAETLDVSGRPELAVSDAMRGEDESLARR